MSSALANYITAGSYLLIHSALLTKINYRLSWGRPRFKGHWTSIKDFEFLGLWNFSSIFDLHVPQHLEIWLKPSCFTLATFFWFLVQSSSSPLTITSFVGFTQQSGVLESVICFCQRSFLCLDLIWEWLLSLYLKVCPISSSFWVASDCLIPWCQISFLILTPWYCWCVFWRILFVILIFHYHCKDVNNSWYVLRCRS